MTLIGTASAYGAKVAAQEAAQRVRAVHDVVNAIQVKIPAHFIYTDRDITQEGRARTLLEAETTGVVHVMAQVENMTEAVAITVSPSSDIGNASAD